MLVPRLSWCCLAAFLLGCRGGRAPVSPGPGGGGDDSGDGGGDAGDDGGDDPVPTADPWRRDEVRSPGSVSFTELQYDPPAGGEPEWLELHNPMVLDMDLSGWSLQGGVVWTFPPGTVLPAGGYLVVSADPAGLAQATGFDAALGPWDGNLANGGERVDLVSNGGRRIDSVAWGDDDPWPVAADGTGLTLAKRAPTAASDHAESWTASARVGGTPGADNGLDPLALPVSTVLLAADHSWRFDASGGEPDPDWAEPDFDDSAWTSGAGPFSARRSPVEAAATAWVTADNHWALYLGAADGSDLRYVGEDSDGSWTTVEALDLEVAPSDHLFVAAWEAWGDSGSPQMLIAEVELPDDTVGTDAASWEWVLGPAGATPGPVPPNPAPTAAEIADVAAVADADGTWDAPAVDAPRTSSPWGGTVGGSFSDAARFVWGDTFAGESVTNVDETYALFRTVDPLLGAGSSPGLEAVPDTAWFRTHFEFSGSGAEARVLLSCTVDDGAVVSLNGVEVARENLPAGALDADTRAVESGEARTFAVELPAEALVDGDNVLAVALHQAAFADEDLALDCSLTARTLRETGASPVILNEVAAAGEAPFWVELRSGVDGVLDLGDLVLATTAGGAVTLPVDSLDPDAPLLLDELDLGVEAGDVLFLTTAAGDVVYDAVRVGVDPRARAAGGGPWRVPEVPTPGDENIVARVEDVVINELMYHRAPVSEAGVPFAERDEEWIELYNRGAEPIDLGGWQLVDAVAFTFPDDTVLAPGGYLVVAGDAAALRAAHPDIDVVGDFSGKLGNGGERILLRDGVGNPADEVAWFDGGRWPAAADGGGSSLELRDPWADNAAAEAWAASDESGRAAWAWYAYRGVAEPSAVGPDGAWEELVLGLLDAGEVLVDDVRVVRDPDGAAVDLVQDGGFDDGAAAWRLRGTHRHSEVVPDPDDPGDPVLRLVATGATGHMHNNVETTLTEPVAAVEYEISFRARWVSGSNQLLSRLYFDRLPRTTLVAQPETAGTPGAPNSTRVDDLGPTFGELVQDPVVPAAGEPVWISVPVDDPDGVGQVRLWVRQADGAWAARDMAEEEPGVWAATVPGLPAGTLVQFWVEAEDEGELGSAFPAGGADSRAFYRVADGEASTTGLHTLRILMSPEDTAWLHEDVNLMSDDLVGATVVWDEREAFHDVGVRLKGSERGRPTQPRRGYAVRFAADHPFRGSHGSVMLDRSEGVGFGQREVLQNLVMTHAGAVSGEFNDLVRLVAPDPAYTSAAELQLDRFSGLVLDAQFEEGAGGARFEYELVYYPTTTDDGTAEGDKLPLPDRVVGTPLTDLGEDKEAWRWIFLLKNNERADDFDGVMALGRLFALPDAELLAAADEVIDVEQWLRAFAFATVSGATDQYGGAGSQHNAQFYVRPADGRVLYFPHDLDFIGGATMPVIGNGDLRRLLADPANARAYYGNLQDILDRAYDADHLAPWCAQLAALLPEQDFAGHCRFVADRAAWIRTGSPDALAARFPAVDFAITTNGGEDVVVAGGALTLEGTAWVDVREIWRDGETAPLDLTWTDETTWQVSVALDPGFNEVVLVATDLQGEVVGTDRIGVTVDAGR